MTGTGRHLVDLLSRKNVLLTDFDGPICAMFAGYPAHAITAELRDLVTANGCGIPAAEPDVGPIDFLRLVADACPPHIVRLAADALRDAELRAAASAIPTAGFEDVLAAAHATRHRVAIVSNNSTASIVSYLDRHDLTRHVDYLSARYDGMDPHHLKPDDHSVRRALDGLSAPAGTAILLGDDPADIQAGRTAGVATIGYANKPSKRERLVAVGPDTVIETLIELADALRATPLAP